MYNNPPPPPTPEITSLILIPILIVYCQTLLQKE